MKMVYTMHTYRIFRVFCAAAAAALMLPVSDADAARLDDIAERGTIRVGTTGDYRPMSYYDAEKGTYEGFDIELAQKIADTLHVKVEFVKTSWPTLTADTQEDLFDIAVHKRKPIATEIFNIIVI